LSGTLGLLSVLGEHLPLGFQCINFCVNTSFGTPGGTESFNIVDITDKSAVSEENQIPVPEDKLKEEQKKEYEELVEKFKRECLKSYNVTRSGDVIKKFDLPFFQPLTEVQRENKMMDAVGQAVAQAFIKSETIMGNMVHNAVVKTFAEGTFPGCMGPCYIQPYQMQYIPLEVSIAAALSAQNSQAGTSNSQAPPQVTTATSMVTADPIYSTTPPIATSVQDGSAPVFPKGWNLATGYGMHSDFFSTPPKMQFKASASKLITSQPDPLATQPMGAQQDASATQPNAQGAWSPQMAAQANASAPPPMTP